MARSSGADIRLAEGRLGDAVRLYEDGLALAIGLATPLRGATDMHIGLADIAYQRGRLEDAKAHLAAGRALRRRARRSRAIPIGPGVVQARIAQAEGDIDAAVAMLLDEAERLYLSDFSPDVRPIAAIRARMLIAHGRLAEARAWADARALSTERRAQLRPRVRARRTLARLLVAEAAEDRHEACRRRSSLLDRLLAAAEQGRRDGSRLEILVVAGTRAARGRRSRRRARRARRGDRRSPSPRATSGVFLDEGPAMIALLKSAASRPDAPRLHPASSCAPATRRRRAPPRQQGLVEPLSERELEVLRLLRSDLDGPDIARELVVSAEHAPDPHEEHLREARRRQSPGRGPPRRRSSACSRPRSPPAEKSPANHHTW